MIPAIHGEQHNINGYFYIPDSVVTYFGDEELIEVLLGRLHKHTFFANVRAKKGTVEESTIVIQINGNMMEGQYEIEISEKRIIILASKSEDVCQALTTLYWMLREGNGACRCGKVKDAPVFLYRGVLIDSCRHFFPVDDMKTILEQLALRKINKIHWHLSDDQGYRIESRRFPKLNEKGSWWRAEDGSLYGGYYTQEQINEILHFSKVRGIEIIPEIDIPGHTSAIISAFPELSCSEEPLEIVGTAGIYSRILCAGKDAVIRFLYELLDEVCGMFPSQYIHIGGDEAVKTEWKQCKACQKRMAENGLNNEEELQAWMTQKISRYVKEKGKKVICWNEVVKSKDISNDIIIQYWDEEETDHTYCENNIGEGQKLIYSYSPFFYFDYSYAMLPLRMPAGSEIKFRSGKMVDETHILGLEATLWSEQIPDIVQLEKMAFPRVFALAERAWGGVPVYSDFLEQCKQEFCYLEQDEVRYTALEEADLFGEKQNQAIINQWKPILKTLLDCGMKEWGQSVYHMIDIKLQEVYGNRQEELENILKKLSN